MRSRIIVLIMLAITLNLISCKQGIQNATITNANDTTGSYAVRNMKGLASFKIDESTYNKTLNFIKNEMKNDKEDRYKYRENKREFPSIGEDMWLSNSGLKDNDERIYVESVTDANKKQNPLIKKNEISYPGYYVGNLKISNLNLSFYKDTLISIECDNSDIEQAFTTKYKPAFVIEETTWKTWFGETKSRPSESAIRNNRALLLDSHDEKRWENEKVKAISYSHYYWRYKNRKQISADGLSYFRIESKNERRNKEMLDNQNSINSIIQNEEKMKEKESINKL